MDCLSQHELGSHGPRRGHRQQSTSHALYTHHLVHSSCITLTAGGALSTGRNPSWPRSLVGLGFKSSQVYTRVLGARGCCTHISLPYIVEHVPSIGVIIMIRTSTVICTPSPKPRVKCTLLNSSLHICSSNNTPMAMARPSAKGSHPHETEIPVPLFLPTSSHSCPRPDHLRGTETPTG